MREIKFRAWDKKEKRMYWNVESAYDSLHCHNVPDDPEECGCDMLSHTFGPSSFGEVLKNENLKIMQFTELKDKNWKDIYEGDVLQMDEESKVLNLEKAVVEYWYGVAHVKPIYDNQFRGTLQDTCFNHLGGKLKDGVSGKVIGNIYENKELLSGPQTKT